MIEISRTEAAMTITIVLLTTIVLAVGLCTIANWFSGEFASIVKAIRRSADKRHLVFKPKPTPILIKLRQAFCHHYMVRKTINQLGKKEVCENCGKEWPIK
jgi:hypothetical protein